VQELPLELAVALALAAKAALELAVARELGEEAGSEPADAPDLLGRMAKCLPNSRPKWLVWICRLVSGREVQLVLGGRAGTPRPPSPSPVEMEGPGRRTIRQKKTKYSRDLVSVLRLEVLALLPRETEHRIRRVARDPLEHLQTQVR